MNTYKVVFEVDMEADDEFEAAEKTQKMLREDDMDWQFYVQKYDDDVVYSVDLAEEESREIEYIPLIK